MAKGKKKAKSLGHIIVKYWGWLMYRIGMFFARFSKYDTVELGLRGRIAEAPVQVSLLARPERRIVPLTQLISLFNEISDDPKVKRLIVRIGPLGIGWAQTQTIARMIGKLTDQGIETIAFFEQGGNKGYLIAAQCNKIVMPPSAVINLLGIMMEVVFLKNLLDKLDVKAQMLAVGKYKSAIEAFTRTSSSPEAKEVAEELVSGLHGQLVDGIAKGRNLTKAKVKGLVDKGPFMSADAKKAGLIDEIAYYEDFKAALKKQDPKPQTVQAAKYLKHRSGLAKNLARLEDRGRLAVVYIQGTITEGRADSQRMRAGSGTLCRNLRSIAKDKKIKGLLIRVSSGGGSSYASDLIWRSIAQVQKKKPVIVSMGDMAASGGYYVSLAGDKVFAEPGTLTGSIGVFAGKAALEGLYSKVGLVKEQFKAGANAGIYSDYKTFNAGEKRKITGMIRQVYKEFLEKVMQGRGMKKAQAEKVAQGRVFLGEMAHQNKLIDEVGGFETAWSVLKNKAAIPDKSPIITDVYPKPSVSLRQLLQPGIGAMLPKGYQQLVEQADWLENLDDGPQYRLPFLFFVE